MLLWALVACAILTPSFAPAQEIPDLVTDRPDQTESPVVVPQGWLQIETGIVFEKDEARSSGVVETTTTLEYPTTLIRYGLLESAELRFELSYIDEKVDRGLDTNLPGLRVEDDRNRGLLAPTIGTKIKIAEEDGLIPEAALIAHLTLPIGNESYRPEYVLPDVRLTMSHSISDNVAFSYNLGGEWDAIGATGIYTASLGLGLTDELGGYVELFGAFPHAEEPEHTVNGGLTYLLMRNLQLDLAAGAGLTDAAPDFFAGAGISLRIPR